MLLALKLAKQAASLGEVPVGCVIVQRQNHQRTIVAATHNLVQTKQNANYHAEMLALDLASQSLQTKTLDSCDLYVTLEPCTMCAAAISHARINRLYYGAADFKQGAVENNGQFFRSSGCFHKPEIYSSIGAQESTTLMQDFFSQLRQKNL